MKTAHEIRQEFIDYFLKKGHTFASASPVVPQADPTLLFINAGMNQFKDVFLGAGSRDYTRAVNSQPCIRVSGKHNDLEEVGRDHTHLTLFEMLGNWSFGDYYKKEAIGWAWELLTEVWGIPKEKLFATVYKTDEEAEQLWRDLTTINPDHILRFGDKDNFWEMGDTGPCGPCSEIHVDLGEGGPANLYKDPINGVNGENERFVELWNLVFIQNNRQKDGSLTDLPATHVDTGAGLERIVSYLQGANSNYNTDLFRPILSRIEALTKTTYTSDDKGMPHRVLADHIRTLSFAIADNVRPSNEGRGYVLRRLLRRAMRYAKQLNVDKPMIYKLVDPVVEVMGEFYTHLPQRKDYIQTLIKAEEESFLRTLSGGVEKFDEVAAALDAGQNTQISGSDAFRLYDTYGFPVDLTQVMAEERGLTVDLDGFNSELDKQKASSRQARKDAEGTVKTDGKTFDIQETEEEKGEALHRGVTTPVPMGGEARLLDDEHHVQKVWMARHHTGTHLLHQALQDVLDTPVEQAGSLVDVDRLRFDFTFFRALTDKEKKEIVDTIKKKIAEELNVEIEETSLQDAKNRGAKALFGEKYDEKKVRVVRIGDYSTELCGGTHLTNTRAMEDFKIISESAVSAGIRRIEAIAGKANIRKYEESEEKKEKAKLEKLIKDLSGKVEKLKHEDQSEDSKKLIEECESAIFKAEELCGSYNQGDINVAKRQADHYLKAVKEGKVIATMKPKSPSEMHTVLLGLKKRVEKALIKFSDQQASANVGSLLDEVEPVQDSAYKLIEKSFPDYDIKMLRTLADNLVNNQEKLMVVLASTSGEKGGFVVKFSQDMKNAPVQAIEVVNELTKIAGGGGGGRDVMAQAGGADPDKVNDALQAARLFIQGKVGSG